MGAAVAIVLVMWSTFTIAGFFPARYRGRPPREGALLGLLLGPVGLIIEVLLPDPDRPEDGIRWSDPRFDGLWAILAWIPTMLIMWWAVRLF